MGEGEVSSFSSSSSSRIAVRDVRGVLLDADGLSFDGDLAYEMLLCRLACADLPRMLLRPALLRTLDGESVDEPGESVLSCVGVDVLAERGCATLSCEVVLSWTAA